MALGIERTHSRCGINKMIYMENEKTTREFELATGDFLSLLREMWYNVPIAFAHAHWRLHTHTPLRCDIAIEWMVGIEIGKMKSHHHATINTNTNTSETWATLMMLLLLFHYFAATETWLFFVFLLVLAFLSLATVSTLVILIENLIYVRIYHWPHITVACFISLKI